MPPSAFFAALRGPFVIFGRARAIRYRFAAQRAMRLSEATAYFLSQGPPPRAALDLREWLLGIPGVGLKTASWIVRNQLGSDEVAIVDVHLWRAGVRAGIFPDNWRLPRDYCRFERAFLLFARVGGVPPSGLDALIWDEQRIMTSRRLQESLLPECDDYVAGEEASFQNGGEYRHKPINPYER